MPVGPVGNYLCDCDYYLKKIMTSPDKNIHALKISYELCKEFSQKSAATIIDNKPKKHLNPSVVIFQ
jgi:hypothetical protein